MAALRGSLEPILFDAVEFRPWQVDGIRWLAQRPNFLCADEMGLGKSLEALTCFSIDVFMQRYIGGFIACPVTLIENWCDEIDKFTTIKYVVMDAKSKMKRNAQMVEFSAINEPKLLITNYEKIGLHLLALNSMQFGAGIFDEAHMLKTWDSKRSKAVHDLNNGRTMMLTGTPMLGQVNDLWSLLHKIAPNDPRVGNYWSFVNNFARYGGYQGKTIVGTKNERKLREILADYQLRRLAKDHLGLDKPLMVPRHVRLTEEQKKVYDKIKQDMKVPDADGGEEEIKYDIVVNTRLRQVATNLRMFTGKDVSPKLDLCMEDDADLIAQGEKVVVFTQFIENIDTYIERHTAKYGNRVPIYKITGQVATGDRKPVVRSWAAVNGPSVLLCMYQVGGVGLNGMQDVCNNMAMLDKLYVPGLNDQAIGRLLRPGQKKPVIVREYRARGTVEDRVDGINKVKIDNAARIIEKQPWRETLKEILINEGKVVEEWAQ